MNRSVRAYATCLANSGDYNQALYAYINALKLDPPAKDKEDLLEKLAETLGELDSL